MMMICGASTKWPYNRTHYIKSKCKTKDILDVINMATDKICCISWFFLPSTSKNSKSWTNVEKYVGNCGQVLHKTGTVPTDTDFYHTFMHCRQASTQPCTDCICRHVGPLSTLTSLGSTSTKALTLHNYYTSLGDTCLHIQKYFAAISRTQNYLLHCLRLNATFEFHLRVVTPCFKLWILIKVLKSWILIKMIQSWTGDIV